MPTRHNNHYEGNTESDRGTDNLQKIKENWTKKIYEQSDENVNLSKETTKLEKRR